MINDTVPERRNLIVFCTLTMMFIFSGGDACAELKLPLVGITLNQPEKLIYFFWAIFIYLCLRFLSAFNDVGYKKKEVRDSNQQNSKYAMSEFLRGIEPRGLNPNRLKWREDGSYTSKYKTVEELLAENNEIYNFRFGVPQDRGQSGVYVWAQGKNKARTASYVSQKLRFVPFYRESVEGRKIYRSSLRDFALLLRNLSTELFKLTKPRILLDTYALSWYLPWFLLFATACTLAWAFLTGSYVTCSAT